MRLVLLAFILASCQTVDTSRLIHSDFQPYVEEFEQHLGHKVDVSVFFAPVFSLSSATPIARCRRFNEDIREVWVYPPAWAELPNDWKRLVIIHELGHCVLKREHNGRINQNIPDSIMYPYIGQTLVNAFLSNPNKYWSELFKENK